MLSSMLVFFGPGEPAQIVLAMFLSLLAIKFYRYSLALTTHIIMFSPSSPLLLRGSFYEPYNDIRDDRLAEASQWLLFVVLVTALLISLKATEDNPRDQAQLGIILTVLSLIPALYMAVSLWLEFIDLAHELRSDEGGEESSPVPTKKLDTKEQEMESSVIEAELELPHPDRSAELNTFAWGNNLDLSAIEASAFCSSREDFDWTAF